MYRMAQHPNANYITVSWMCAANSNANWSQGCGVTAYGPTWNYLGPVSKADDHQDNGYDVNGYPTFVIIDGSDTASPTQVFYYELEIVNLATLSTSGFTSKFIQLPCTYAYAGTPCPNNPYLQWKGAHISMTGTWGSSTISGVPGYALFSTVISSGSSTNQVDFPNTTTLGTAVTTAGSHTVTPGSMADIGVGTVQLIDCGTNGGGCSTGNGEAVTVTAVTGTTFTATFANTHASTATVANLSAGDTGWGAMENIAIKIDTTCTSPCAAQFWRLGRAMSIRDADYGAEPHTSANRDWTAYTWGSNWNVDNGTDESYYTQLSGSTPSYPLTVSITGNGASYGSLTGTDCTTGTYTAGTEITCTPVATVGSGWVFTGFSGACTGFALCQFPLKLSFSCDG